MYDSKANNIKIFMMVTNAKDLHANAKPKEIKQRTIHAYGTMINRPDLLVS